MHIFPPSITSFVLFCNSKTKDRHSLKNKIAFHFELLHSWWICIHKKNEHNIQKKKNCESRMNVTHHMEHSKVLMHALYFSYIIQFYGLEHPPSLLSAFNLTFLDFAIFVCLFWLSSSYSYCLDFIMWLIEEDTKYSE